MTRIVIADDHAIVRRGLLQIISEAKDLSVVGEAKSADELLVLLRAQATDVVVLDLSLGVRNGIDVLKYVKSEFPKVAVLMLSMHAEDLFAVRALRAGASGYVQKDSDPEVLISAIRLVASGGTYVSRALAESLANEVRRGAADALPHERLSDREFEIFRLLGMGKSVTEISHDLNLSVKTVSTHRSRILAKTTLQNNAEIVDYVIAHGLR